MKKSVIIVLGILVILFVLSLNAGYLRDRKEGWDELSMDKAKEMKKKWVGALDNRLGPFQPAFDMRRISPDPPCLKQKDTLLLTDEKDCYIQISDSVDGEEIEAIENLVLKVAGEDVAVKMVDLPDEDASDESASEPGNRSRSRRARIRPTPVKPIIGKWRPPGVKPPPDRPAPLLTIAYFPDGKEEETGREYRPEGNIRLTIFPEGGILRLKCEGCDPEQKTSIEIKMK